LANEGIPKSEIEKHRKAIKDYIQLLVEEETLRDETSDDEDSKWDSLSVRMEKMVLSDDPEYESVESDINLLRSKQSLLSEMTRLPKSIFILLGLINMSRRMPLLMFSRAQA
jgi:hypothetical protein